MPDERGRWDAPRSTPYTRRPRRRGSLRPVRRAGVPPTPVRGARLGRTPRRPWRVRPARRYLASRRYGFRAHTTDGRVTDMFEYFPDNYIWSLGVAATLNSGGCIDEVDRACRPIRELARQGSDVGTREFMASWQAVAGQLESQADEAA